jgi:DNA-binding SARP family transcriptional activator
MSKKGAFFLIAALLNIIPLAISAQPYGLIFSAYEVAQEKRTSLDLAGGPLCLSDQFELSFNLSFIPNRSTYFGYVFRLLNKHRQNIDLVYSQQQNVFNVIAGETLTGIRFRIDQQQLFGKWSRLALRSSGDTLSFFVNGRLIGKTAMSLKDDCFRIVFGASNLDGLKSTDLPPMQLGNIAIAAGGRLKYFWPLRESGGNVATDSLRRLRASVSNPTWAADLFTHWQPLLSLKVNGSASVAFDSAKEELHIVGKDTIYRYSLKDRSLTGTGLSSPKHILLRGNQSFYHPVRQQLYNYFIDLRRMTAFQPLRRSWEHPFDTADVTTYWHANKFFSASQNALYVLGGYGQLKYRNKITRYRFTDATWEELPAKGDFFTPRYLAALGANASGDTAYILGGYGSTTGEQILNPRYLYDLLLFDVKQQSFRKIYTLPQPPSSFVFANTMILDGSDSSFYAFTFPNDRFHSRLQLVRGSLRQPVYTEVGDTIPYIFQDNQSYADLFFCPADKMLLAVTMHREKNEETVLHVYTIGFPPDKILPAAVASSGLPRWLMLALGLFLLLLLFYLFSRGRKRGTAFMPPPGSILPDTPLPPAPEPAAQLLPAERPVIKPAVLLFGPFTVIDPAGNDISRAFTPLLKELFLLIVIHTVKNGQGISPEDLHEILWNDKSGDAAKNNRAVNMRKLKNILGQLGDVVLKKESGKWVLEYRDAGLHIDLVDFLLLLNERRGLDGEGIRQLLNIVRRGAFLHHTDYQWLDDIKSDISNKVLDVLIQAGGNLSLPKDAALMIEMADSIFCFDAVNEQALRLKCKSLVVQGRHALAKNAYEKFVKEYRHMYDEDFPESFNGIIG